MPSGRIILADDEPHVTAVVAKKLRGAGYEVSIAEDGEEALALATEHTPDLIVTDLQMPYMSGIELATQLKADPLLADVPVVMLTARGYVLSDGELARTNVRRMLSKPFSAVDLLGLVNELLDFEPLVDREAA